jgi:hypothetical protein
MVARGGAHLSRSLLLFLFRLLVAIELSVAEPWVMQIVAALIIAAVAAQDNLQSFMKSE